MAHPPHDLQDPDNAGDGMALIEAHARRDGEAVRVLLEHACGTCTANFLAWLLARMIATDPDAAREGTARLRDLAARGGD